MDNIQPSTLESTCDIGKSRIIINEMPNFIKSTYEIKSETFITQCCIPMDKEHKHKIMHDCINALLQ